MFSDNFSTYWARVAAVHNALAARLAQHHMATGHQNLVSLVFKAHNTQPIIITEYFIFHAQLLHSFCQLQVGRLEQCCRLLHWGKLLLPLLLLQCWPPGNIVD
jgi:hypothetical protein